MLPSAARFTGARKVGELSVNLSPTGAMREGFIIPIDVHGSVRPPLLGDCPLELPRPR